MPPSRSGEASRQRRSACPRPIAAAVIGFSGSRGSCSDFHGQRHDDRVERAGERRAAQRDPAQQRLGVRDGGRPGEDGDGGELARRGAASAAVAQRAGERVEEPAER